MAAIAFRSSLPEQLKGKWIVYQDINPVDFGFMLLQPASVLLANEWGTNEEMQSSVKRVFSYGCFLQEISSESGWDFTEEIRILALPREDYGSTVIDVFGFIWKVDGGDTYIALKAEANPPKFLESCLGNHQYKACATCEF